MVNYSINIVDINKVNENSAPVKPDTQFTLPFCPTIGTNLVFKGKVYTVNRVDVMADQIVAKIAAKTPPMNPPQMDGKLIIPQVSTNPQNIQEIIVPVVVLSTIMDPSTESDNKVEVSNK